MFIMLFFLTRMCLRWVMCSFSLANTFSLFMASYNMSTLLWCFFFFYQRANNIDAVMWNSYQRICSALLYATFASEYGYAGLWNSFSSYYVRAVMRSYCWVLCMLLARSGFTRSVFIFCLSSAWLNQIGVAALSVKIEALEKQVSADSVDRALVCVRQLAGQPGSTTDMLDN